MHVRRQFVRLMALVGVVAGCEGSAPAPLASTTVQSLEAAPLGDAAAASLELGSGLIATSDGQEHSYFFRVPAGAAPPAGRPVLIWLHGDGGTGQGFGAGFYPYTDADGAVLVTPNGTNRTWTHAAADLPGLPLDSQFLSLLIDRLVTEGIGAAHIDPARIYLGGESRGAFMPYYLLMRASTRERLAAVAVNAGTVYCQPGDVECDLEGGAAQQQAPTAILHLHDTQDVESTPVPTATFHSPLASDDWRVFFPMKLWAKQNGCFAGDYASAKDNGVLRESFTVGGKAAALYDLSAWGSECSKYQLLLVSSDEANRGHVIPGQHERIWQFLRQYDLQGLGAPQPEEPVPPEGPVPPEKPVDVDRTSHAGRLLWGSCVPVCASDASDADEAGITDGWGYENDLSCVVLGGVVESQGAPCDLAPPAPAAGEPQSRPAGNLSTGFFVSGGRLYDGLGRDFVMRGINHPLAWHPSEGLDWLDQVALTGANAVRLVWNTKGPVPLLDAAIARTLAQHMVPMVELHDVMGGEDPEELLRMAQYYIDELHDVLVRFEGQLLINIANEWSGDLQAYSAAITVLRDAGILHTLVIDANDWGQGGDALIAAAPGLLEADPQHNLLFSVHMYAQHFAEPADILRTLRAAAAAKVPFIVGEFGSTEELEEGGPGIIPVQVLLEEAERLRLGYLAWVWTGFDGKVGSMDLSVDGSAAHLTSWGDEVVNGPFGIRKTSQLASLFAAPPAPAPLP